jgi:CTP synthase
MQSMGSPHDTSGLLASLSISSDPGDRYQSVPKGYQIGRTGYIVITGSVMSGLGKGIFSASLASLLQLHGYSCNLIKMDGYFNEDAGTLSPFRHGEVFVLDDGTECDMDIGTYERFTNNDFCHYNIFTNGRLNKRINSLERSGHYRGGDVQMFPHVTGEVNRFIRESSHQSKADFTLIEIGGTVGDEENRTYLNAMSDLLYEEGTEHLFFINLVWVIEASHLNEQKTKAAQHGSQLLMQMGIKPDMIVCRAEHALEKGVQHKLGSRLRIPPERVVDCRNLDTIYQVPGHLMGQKVDRIVLDYFGKPAADATCRWNEYTEIYLHPKKTVRVGLTGKYLGPRDTYASVHNALEHAATSRGVRLEIADVRTDHIEEGITEAAGELETVQGIVVPGGFGKRGAEGKIACVEYARTKDLPYLGLCYGFQMAAIEYARHVCNLPLANTTENEPETADPVVCLLPDQYRVEGIGANMRLGGRDVQLDRSSRAFALYLGSRLLDEGKATVHERFRHRYELNPEYRERLVEAGLRFPGWAPDQPIAQILELPEHAFFIGTQYHPEFTSRPFAPHPLFGGFIDACLRRG